MNGSPWAYFFVLLLVEAVAAAVLVGIAVRSYPAARRAGIVVVLGVLAAPGAAVLHNILSAITGAEETVTFLVALLVAPLAIVVGLFAVAAGVNASAHELAIAFRLAGSGLALFPIYGLLVIAVSLLSGGPAPYQGALEAMILPMCLAVTALGVAYAGLELLRPHRSAIA